MSTNLENRERQRKRESKATGRRSSTRKELERVKKKETRRHILLEEQHKNFVAALRK